MNARRVLVCSLVLNVALLVAFAWLVQKRKPIATNREKAEQATSTGPAKPTDRAVAATAQSTLPAEPVKPLQPFDWRMVESEDYKKYIANLRSIGCPEETIRDIIIADVEKLFASRRQAISGSTNKFEFWKTGNFLASVIDEQKIAQQQQLAREKRALLKELLGFAPEEKPDLFGGANPMEMMLDFLPASKQSEVAEIFQKYQAKMMKGFGGGAPDGDDLKNMQKTQREMEAELAKLLTPEELQDYQLRLSQTAMMMRMQLTSFEPSEQEFRDIFKEKKAFDDEFGAFGMLNQSKEEKEKYNTAKKGLEEKLKTVLGETRFTEYERAQDYAYQSIYRTAERNNLGKGAANKVYDMKKAAEEEAKKVRQDKSLSSEQQKEALKGIRAETERSIQQVFGPTAWESYRKQQSAYWLKSLSPDPRSEE